MELRFGAPVVEAGRRLGRLAGLEVDAAARRVTAIVFSPDGRLGAHAKARPLGLVQVSGRRVAVSAAPAAGPQPRPAEPLIWSRSTRLTRAGRELGRLRAVTVDSTTGTVERVAGRRRFWLGRVTLAGADLDLSIPGELAVRQGTTRVA